MYKKIIIISSFFLFSLCSFSSNKKQNLNIVFIGDSITYGANLSHPETDAPPVLTCTYLEKQPGIGKVQFSNQGVCGFTTVDFLPFTGTIFKNVEEAANTFYKDKDATLIFSIMLGTNDSAVKGTNGCPVSAEDYRQNMTVIINKLLQDYPGCKIIINHPVWYSPNTYNGAEYMQEGLTRLQSYFPEISTLVKPYAVSFPHRVFEGDTKAFRYFKKNHLAYLGPESGQRGTFYLHPNEEGAAKLADFWAKAIYRITGY
ncbi:MAG: GDSL-type esterase/lipase family protein [Ignavibacteriaceae bacterium]|nr:GDSL-type esterase/lipase family protein [Ignavibacteriaceae bacterium]